MKNSFLIFIIFLFVGNLYAQTYKEWRIVNTSGIELYKFDYIPQKKIVEQCKTIQNEIIFLFDNKYVKVEYLNKFCNDSLNEIDSFKPVTIGDCTFTFLNKISIKEPFKKNKINFYYLAINKDNFQSEIDKYYLVYSKEKGLFIKGYSLETLYFYKLIYNCSRIKRWEINYYTKRLLQVILLPTVRDVSK